MAVKQITSPVLLLALLSVLSISFSTALRYQTLSLNSKQHPTFSRPQSETKPNINTLSVQLIHRDELIPHTSNITREALLLTRLKRDILRFKAISRRAAATASQSVSISSPLSSGNLLGSLQYLARVGVGTPTKPVYLAIDTGSDVVWLQCRPCKSCYEQAHQIFDPSKSSSFSPISCADSRCQKLYDADYSDCSINSKSSCLYNYTYGDGSFTFGNLSTETLTFGKAEVDDVVLGCGHDNEGTFGGFAGLLGLGRGDLSFLNQTGIRSFSYCLMDMFTNSTGPPSSSSSILFGDLAVSPKTNFTRMVHNPKTQLDRFYYVSLEGISVGGHRVPDITPALFEIDANGNNGVIIDSGTSFTRLTKPAYEALRDAFVKAMNYTVVSTPYKLWETCYDFSGVTGEVMVPTVELHFEGADMELPADNSLIMMDENGTFCFGFFGQEEGDISLIGNMQQQGFRISYDLNNNRIGITADGCSV